MSIHAHFDDFEFVAGGLFELWRRQLGGELRARVLVCTDGKAGHHVRTREETARLRLQEQEQSARAGQFEFGLLRLPGGEVPRDGCLQVTTPLLAALWRELRAFEPGYVFCPPWPSDPLAGIHVDHVGVSEAVRKVAYMINVPQAFTPEFPEEKAAAAPKKVPVIVTVHDAYMSGENAYDLAVDVEEVFETIVEMTWCHQSQIAEWIPWVGRHSLPAPRSKEDWGRILRAKLRARNREMGLASGRLHEFFTVTAWGEVPDLAQIRADFPGLSDEFCRFEALEKRLKRWRGEA